MTKRALITGVTGMVGSHLLDFLLDSTDIFIIGAKRWRSDTSNLIHPGITDASRVKLVNMELTDYSSIERVVKEFVPDFIFHLAAQSFPTTSFSAPAHTLDVNVIGTANLLEVIRCQLGYQPRIHVCSSSEVFGRVPQSLVPIGEDCPFHPASPYAISKMGTDSLGRYYGEAFGMRTVVTRMFTHTGPRRGEVFAESSFAKQIAEAELGMRQATISVGNLDSMRTWADVRDAVNAYWLLINSDYDAGDAFNIGGNYSCTIGEMLNFLLSKSTIKHFDVRVSQELLRPLDADLQIPNIGKFQKQTGWRCKYSFEETMTDLLDYWRAKLGRV